MRVAVIAQTTGGANQEERKRLKLGKRDQVVRVVRLRSDAKGVLSYECVVLAVRRFPGIDAAKPATMDIYGLAGDHGLALGRAVERLQRVAASGDVARHLGVDVGTSVVRLDRVVGDGEGSPLEWRIAFVAR